MIYQLERRVQQGAAWLFTHPDGIKLNVPTAITDEIGNPSVIEIDLAHPSEAAAGEEDGG